MPKKAKESLDLQEISLNDIESDIGNIITWTGNDLNPTTYSKSN